jgi:hypothetical protein
MEQRRHEADRAASVISGTTGPGPASTPNMRETICIKINAIQVNVAGGVPTPTAQAVMLKYEHTSCGWYSDSARWDGHRGYLETVRSKTLFQKRPSALWCLIRLSELSCYESARFDFNTLPLRHADLSRPGDPSGDIRWTSGHGPGNRSHSHELL